jgi:hypothetical protein
MQPQNMFEYNVRNSNEEIGDNIFSSDHTKEKFHRIFIDIILPTKQNSLGQYKN